MTAQDKKQIEFANTFLNGTLRNTLVLATGFGKSYLSIMIMKHLYKVKGYNRFIIIVNSAKLRDTTWTEEITKFGPELLPLIELYTYQTAYKWKKAEKDLSNTFIVADEIDFAVTKEYFKIFEEYDTTPTLGLTGFITKEKEEKLKKFLPILVRYTNEDAVRDKVINPFEIIFVKFDLDKNPKGIKIEYKKNGKAKSFYQTENQAYNYADTQFMIAYSEYKQAMFDFTMGMTPKAFFTDAENKMKAKRNARTKLLYNSIASKNTAIKLVEAILAKDEENKVVIFSKRTKQCDSICSYTYHGKNTSKVNESNYNKFVSGEIRKLGAASKIDRGVTIPGLNNIILESFDSSATVLSQRFGRTQRLGIENKARVYIMLPYYMKEVAANTFEPAETQAIKWAKKALADYDISKAKVIDLRTIK